MFSIQPFIPTIPGQLALLRRALADEADVLAKVQEAFAEERMRGLCLSVGGTPLAFTGWRWKDDPPTYAQLLFMYAAPGAAPEHIAALVGETLSAIRATAAVIEIPAPVDTPDFREVLDAQDFVFFERCNLIATLSGVDLPAVSAPDGYSVAVWSDQHQPQVERVALEANPPDAIDSAAVPDAADQRLIDILRSLRVGRFPGIDRWCAASSLVALTPEGTVCGYIATVVAQGIGFVADMSIHPAHRRKGVARLLLRESMAACQHSNMPVVGLAVTTRNPARQLYESMGFSVAFCGQVGVWWRDGRHLRWRV
ncbi:MAG: GNAT family N-acetyltransferase [Anaerolineae bacterium]|nr:GNAT family N-acetyltransferase [Anaerolineae bacterium]